MFQQEIRQQTIQDRNCAVKVIFMGFCAVLWAALVDSITETAGVVQPSVTVCSERHDKKRVWLKMCSSDAAVAPKKDDTWSYINLPELLTDIITFFPPLPFIFQGAFKRFCHPSKNKCTFLESNVSYSLFLCPHLKMAGCSLGCCCFLSLCYLSLCFTGTQAALIYSGIKLFGYLSHTSCLNATALDKM